MSESLAHGPYRATVSEKEARTRDLGATGPKLYAISYRSPLQCCIGQGEILISFRIACPPRLVFPLAGLPDLDWFSQTEALLDAVFLQSSHRLYFVQYCSGVIEVSRLLPMFCVRKHIDLSQLKVWRLMSPT